MPYITKGKCVYRKDTGKKVGCTKGSVKKYITALRIATANESFKTFKQFFFESIDFNKLPDTCPYGFWISMDEIIPVPDNHITTATRHLGKNRNFSEGSMYTQMYNRGFVRVVAEKSEGVMYIQSSANKPNISARRVARDVALHYGLQPVLENDKLFESVQDDLSPSAPYGFWIKYNEVIPVRGGPGAHWNVGRTYLLKKGIDTNSVHEQMFKLGFVRCVFDVIDVDANMNIEFKPGVTPGESIKKAETVAEHYGSTPYVSAIRG